MKHFALIFLLITFYSISYSNIDSIPIDSSFQELILDYGRTYKDKPYKYGGHHCSTGFDCSGFLFYIYKMAGVQLPRSSKELYKIGHEIDLIHLKKGDFVFFNTLQSSTISHVGIITETNNETVKMLHVSSSKGVQEIDIISSKYWYSRFVSARRLFILKD